MTMMLGLTAYEGGGDIHWISIYNCDIRDPPHVSMTLTMTVIISTTMTTPW